ncbi:MAG: O-antigen ligase family protein [Acidobacteria bacterium]|nr:O-antigen ligase family protein [Acidobacteriota bacterium]
MVVPLAIVSCLVAGGDSRAPIAVSLALIAYALIWRLTPSPQPLSISLAYPAVVFGLLPLLQTMPLPASIWRRVTTINLSLQSEVAQLGVVLPSTWSFQPEASLRFAVVAIAAIAAFLLARHASARRIALWSLLVSLMAITTWQALEGLGQHFAGLWLLDDGEVAHGRFLNRGYYAAFLNAGLWLAIGVTYSQTARSIISPVRVALVIGSIFTALLSFAAIVASQSRSALLVDTLLLCAAISLLRVSRYKRAVLALSAFVCGGLFLSTPIASPLFERFRQLYDLGGDPGRLLIWRDSLAALTSLGSGAGSFPWAFARTTPYFLRKSVDTAHSDYIEWAVEFGPWFAALFAISLVVALARLLLQAQRTADREHRALALGAVFGAGALALHALTDSVLHFPALLLLLACLLGLALGLTKPISTNRQPLGTALLAAGLCSATVLLGGVLAPLSLAALFPAARQSQLDGDASGARQGFVAVLRANPRTAPAWLALAEIARVQGDTLEALRYVRAARSVEPFTYRVEWPLDDL